MQTSEAVVAMTAMLVSFGLPLVVIAIVLYYKHLPDDAELAAALTAS